MPIPVSALTILAEHRQRCFPLRLQIEQPQKLLSSKVRSEKEPGEIGVFLVPISTPTNSST